MQRFCLKLGLPLGILMLVLAHSSAVMAVGRPVQAEENVEHRAIAQTRLADAKLKVCQNREKAINNIMARIADRGQKHLDLVSGIAARVEAFYVQKGKTLSSYDQLVANANAKKAAAQAAVDTVKSDSASFKCDGTDPKGVVVMFKNNMKAEVTALQNYRAAAKALIVGVKSVQSPTSSTGNGGQR